MSNGEPLWSDIFKSLLADKKRVRPIVCDTKHGQFSRHRWTAKLITLPNGIKTFDKTRICVRCGVTK